jgi:hypothetical protein
MQLTNILVVALQLCIAAARPYPIPSTRSGDLPSAHARRAPSLILRASQQATGRGSNGAAQNGTTGGEAGTEEGEDNEVEIESEFGTAVRLEGGNLKQDVLFPAGVG